MMRQLNTYAFLGCWIPSPREAFVFIERLGETTLEAYSFGNGDFILGTPTANTEVCFKVDKNVNSLNIRIHQNGLLKWLRAIFLPHDNFNDVLSDASISMDTLLPRYPEISAKFDQDKREGRSFDALELFVCHFLREGSIFASFGFERLRVNYNFTELHFHDIHSRNHSVSEDLDLLDDAVDELDKEDTQDSSHSFPFVNEPFLSQLQAAITQRDIAIVRNVLAMGPGFVDAKTLCLAIRHYEKAVFHLLLECGAQVNGDGFFAVPLHDAAEAGLMDAVRLLLRHGANVEGNSCILKTPMCGAASGGHLGIVQYLFKEKGANIDGTDGHKYPLSHAIEHRHAYVIDYLLRAGANVLQTDYLELLSQFVVNKDIFYGDVLERSIAGMNENTRQSLLNAAFAGRHVETFLYLMKPLSEPLVSPLLQKISLPGAAELNGQVEIATDADYRPRPRGCRNSEPVGESVQSSWSSEEVSKSIGSCWSKYGEDSEALDVKNCPAAAAIQVQNRRIMTRRLMAKVASSRKKLLDAGTRMGASARFIAFVGHFDTSLSVWRSGTRAIRDICEGYMPHNLSDIVSALQVADAMRSVVPPSQLRCSSKEFVDDIPRWAALLSPDDQDLLLEIAYYLWGVPASATAPSLADNFQRPLEALQLLVDSLVRGSGLFDHGSGNSCGSYRLQTLRQQYLFETRCDHICGKRLRLTNWCPSPTQGASGNLHTDSSKPPDPEIEWPSLLARITVFIAGAIFGAILLYLFLSRSGFLIPRLPILTPYDGKGWASDQIITRNSVILSMYLGFTSPIEFGSCKSINELLPDSLSAEKFFESSYDNYVVVDSPGTVDTIMELAPADSSPIVSSNLSASSSTTIISPSPITTPRNVPSILGASMDGTICCEHCSSSFKLGRNGRRGQASNLQKHIKNYHPETLQNYHREIYKCRYGCSVVDPNKWNIKVHEEKHCANKKGKQPRRHGKWRHVTTGTA